MFPYYMLSSYFHLVIEKYIFKDMYMVVVWYGMAWHGMVSEFNESLVLVLF